MEIFQGPSFKAADRCDEPVRWSRSFLCPPNIGKQPWDLHLCQSTAFLGVLCREDTMTKLNPVQKCKDGFMLRNRVSLSVGQGSVINNRVLVAAESRKSPDRVLSGSQSVDRAGERPQSHTLVYWMSIIAVCCLHMLLGLSLCQTDRSTLSQTCLDKRTIGPTAFVAWIHYFFSLLWQNVWRKQYRKERLDLADRFTPWWAKGESPNDFSELGYGTMWLSWLHPTSLQPQRSLPHYGAWRPVGYLPKRPLPLCVFLLDRQHSSVRISYITSCDQSSKSCYHTAQFLPVKRIRASFTTVRGSRCRGRQSLLAAFMPFAFQTSCQCSNCSNVNPTQLSWEKACVHVPSLGPGLCVTVWYWHVMHRKSPPHFSMPYCAVAWQPYLQTILTPFLANLNKTLLVQRETPKTGVW